MKLIGSYTSPYVRKIFILLLEKGLTFEFVNDIPWESTTHVPQYNPLGKIPALVTADGEIFMIHRSSLNTSISWMPHQNFCPKIANKRCAFAS